MGFKFEKLEVWQEALDFADAVYKVTKQLPADERFNLVSQMQRAATSVGLNIAEGSTGQSDKEQIRFLNCANRSLLETVACMHLIHRRQYVKVDELRTLWKQANSLSKRLQAFKKSLSIERFIKEEPPDYELEEQPPF